MARAFDLAWQRWPEVARQNDPAGWVRAAAYDYALTPWQRWVPGRRTAAERRAADRAALAAALLRLPPAQRTAVLLHDGLGLDLPAAAAETATSTRAAQARITRARAALHAAVPEGGDDIPARLAALLAGDARPPDRPAAVRDASDRGVRRRTVAAVAVTALLAVAATLTGAFVTDSTAPPSPRRAAAPLQPGVPAEAPP